MASHYISINLNAAGGTDDKRTKISNDDSLPGFLEEKIEAGSTKVVVTTTNPGAAEILEVDVDETQINHDNLLNHEVDQHRVHDDTTTTTTSLWSSQKIQDELDTKINAATPMTDNKLVKSIGTSGVDVEATGIDVDDSNNVTGINNLIIDGDLTVNGTTTSVNSATLEVTDANITINNGGTQAAADAANAGITVEMSDATDVELGYDSTTASKMTLGEIGSQSEIITANHVQTVSNKILDADNNTINNLEVDNLKAGVLSTDLDVAVDNNNIPGSQAVKDYVAARVAEKDDASEITYGPATALDWDVLPTHVDGSLDELASRTNTVEDNLTLHLGAGSSKHNAAQITNVAAGNIAATTVQDAINELDTEKYIAASFDGDFDTRLATKDTDDLSEGITNLYFTPERAFLEPSDITNTSFSFLNNIAVPTNITGLLFAIGAVRSFTAYVSVNRAGDSLYEEYEIKGINKGTGFDISIESVGDDTGVELSITTAGQLQYSSSALTSDGNMVFRAKVNSI